MMDFGIKRCYTEYRTGGDNAIMSESNLISLVY